ncbi:MAG: AI-2E family transporter [Chthoniobacterales bacterium]|nr:AI-2E family transporter [Chthoniobacterales bacterium]
MANEQIRAGASNWQRTSWYAALTAASFVVILAVVVAAVWIVVETVAFLQPLLIPVVAAVVLTYLLSPAVDKLCSLGFSRLWAVIALFAIIAFGAAGIALWVGPAAWNQASHFSQTLPEQASRGQKLLLSTLEWVRDIQQKFAPPPVLSDERTVRDELWAVAGGYAQNLIAWLQERLPSIVSSVLSFLQRSAGGFLGVAGAAVSLFLVPLFLFFFLKDSASFARDWKKYIPLPESRLRSEVASLVEEINGYLIRYFRGQFAVSLIDGALIGIALWVMGLNFALLIGLAVGVLALIPYVGLIICWVPAVLIAVAQFGDWTHPIIVTAIFVGMSNIESFFIAPRIVGDSVSLHPLTVILSVLVWSLVLGVVLGSLLAVPLTATIKVLLQRYVWGRAV